MPFSSRVPELVAGKAFLVPIWFLENFYELFEPNLVAKKCPIVPIYAQTIFGSWLFSYLLILVPEKVQSSS